jgi:hypothetical protein
LSGGNGERSDGTKTRLKRSAATYNSEDSDRSHETNNEDVENDKDPRPAKRRRLPLR